MSNEEKNGKDENDENKGNEWGENGEGSPQFPYLKVKLEIPAIGTQEVIISAANPEKAIELWPSANEPEIVEWLCPYAPNGRGPAKEESLQVSRSGEEKPKKKDGRKLTIEEFAAREKAKKQIALERVREQERIREERDKRRMEEQERLKKKREQERKERDERRAKEAEEKRKQKEEEKRKRDEFDEAAFEQILESRKPLAGLPANPMDDLSEAARSGANWKSKDEWE